MTEDRVRFWRALRLAILVAGCGVVGGASSFYSDAKETAVRNLTHTK